MIENRRLRLFVIYERRGLCQDRVVTRFADVIADEERQPEIVVAARRVIAEIGERVPPVIDRAVLELPRRVQHDLALGSCRIKRQPDLAVLELIAEPERARLLVVTRAPPHAPRERLVRQPVVVEQIKVRAIRLHLCRADQIVPELVGPAGRIPRHLFVGVLVHHRETRFLVRADRQHKVQPNGCARRERKIAAQRRRGIAEPAEPRLSQPRDVAHAHRLRCRGRPVFSEERRLVRHRERAIELRPRDAVRRDVRPRHVPVLALGLGPDVPHVLSRDDRAPVRRFIERDIEEEAMKLPLHVRRDAARPLEERSDPQAPRLAGRVGDLDTPDLDLIDGIDNECPSGAQPAAQRAEHRAAQRVLARELVVRATTRGRCEGPDVRRIERRIEIRDVQELPVAVANQVHLPARQHVVLRIIEPREPAPVLADHQPVSPVADHVHPRHRGVVIRNDERRSGRVGVIEMSKAAGEHHASTLGCRGTPTGAETHAKPDSRAMKALTW